MKKKSIYGLVVCFLSIILIILAWNYRQKINQLYWNLACLLRVIGMLRMRMHM